MYTSFYSNSAFTNQALFKQLPVNTQYPTGKADRPPDRFTPRFGFVVAATPSSVEGFDGKKALDAFNQIPDDAAAPVFELRYALEDLLLEPDSDPSQIQILLEQIDQTARKELGLGESSDSYVFKALTLNYTDTELMALMESARKTGDKTGFLTTLVTYAVFQAARVEQFETARQILSEVEKIAINHRRFALGGLMIKETKYSDPEHSKAALYNKLYQKEEELGY
jgi:hypothetical protein